MQPVEHEVVITLINGYEIVGTLYAENYNRLSDYLKSNNIKVYKVVTRTDETLFIFKRNVLIVKEEK